MSEHAAHLHYARSMRGDLVEKTAADVCRELAAREASGILAIDGPGGPGRVVFADGRIIAAVSPTPRARLGDRLVGAGELDPDDLANALAAQQEKGESLPLGSLLVERGLVRRDAVRVFVQEQVLDALFEIIRWRYGAFTFSPDDDARGHGVPLSLSVDDALVEVARRQHEWNELSQVIPDLDSVPSFRVGAASASAALEPDEFAVLASVDGVRSVRSLAADLGYGEFEAARIVYGLSLLGIVDVRPPQDEIGAALDDALGLGDFEPFDREDAPPAESSSQPEEEAPSAEHMAADAEPTPSPADPDPASDPPPAPSHLRVVADPPDADAPDADPSTDLPAPPAPPTDPPPPSELTPAARSREPEEEPEVWVSTDEPDATMPVEPGEPAMPEHDSEPDAPRETEPTIDAEVELPADAVAETDLPSPPDDDDTSRWEDLFTAAEQAVKDRPTDENEAPDPTVPPPPVSSGGTAAPTTGPEPWDATPPRTSPAADPEPDRAPPPADTPPPEPSGPEAPERPAARTADPSPEDPAGDPTVGSPDLPERPAPPGQRGDDNDVSEFLRELSRLSVDGPSESGAAKPPYRPPSSSGSSSSDADNKKKRRGLFGRG